MQRGPRAAHTATQEIGDCRRRGYGLRFLEGPAWYPECGREFWLNDDGDVIR